ncbi:MAG: poly-gamma-glutamate synthase PgsB [Bacteroidales bacterium]
MYISIILLSLITLWFIIETMVHNRRLNRIPLRITVSGTRGKSGTTRDIASVLRVSGRRVLAKTTGSEPMYILPDGSEKPVPRRGIVSIIEQKRVVRKAVETGVDCIVTEIMSINPENHRAESQKILKPHITVLTNFRPDHLDVTEKEKTSVESVFLNDICRGSKVYIHSEFISEFLNESVIKLGAKLNVVNSINASGEKRDYDRSGFRIRQNTDLVFAVCRGLGVTDRVIGEGLASSVHDRGRAEVLCLQKGEKTVWFASTFAANDPVSTAILADKILKESGEDFRHIAGLLSLRSDRAERTKQWIDYFSNGSPIAFSPLFVAGNHSRIVKRRMPDTVIIPFGSPEKITDFIMDRCLDRTIVFGLANIAGTGMAMTEHWHSKTTEQQ